MMTASSRQSQPRASTNPITRAVTRAAEASQTSRGGSVGHGQDDPGSAAPTWATQMISCAQPAAPHPHTAASPG